MICVNCDQYLEQCTCADFLIRIARLRESKHLAMPWDTIVKVNARHREKHRLPPPDPAP